MSTTINAIITGGSSGLGLALTRALLARGHQVTIDGRRADLLARLEHRRLRTVVGDVTDPDHRTALLEAATAAGPLDLVINNASELGGSPPPPLESLDSATFERLWRTNVDAPLQLIRQAVPRLAPAAVMVSISSDAAVEHYPGWGGYAATKAALDHLTLTWAAEHPGRTWYAVDPGDLRTPMHQAAFPGEDISDRPEPASVVPGLLALLSSGLPSGRYRLAELTDLAGHTETLKAIA